MSLETCAIYARVSTDEQDLTPQLVECRRFAEFRKWEVRDEYTDHGVSGKKATRPALERLMDAVRKGRIRRVLVWKLDRFGRNAGHFSQAIEEFDRLGVEFVSVTENLETRTPMGRLVMTILAAVAQMERENIVERTKAGIAHARRQGKRLGRPKACSPGEVARLLEEGLGPSEIARRLKVGRATVARRKQEAIDRGLYVAQISTEG